MIIPKKAFINTQHNPVCKNNKGGEQEETYHKSLER